MRPDLLPADVVETTLSFLTGFDAFSLSHSSRDWLCYLSDGSFWRRRLRGNGIEAQGPPWMNQIKGRSFRLKQRMSTIFQRELGQQWKKRYMQEKSVLFRGMGSREFLNRHQRGPYAYLEHNAATESRHQRPMDYFAGSRSLSFDVWLCLLPDTRTGTTTRHHGRCGGGVVYALDCDDLGGDRWQPVVVDSKYNLYCSLLEAKTMVASNLEANRWFHLALTYDHDFQIQKVYLDGKIVHSETGSRRRAWTRMAYQQIGTGHIAAGEGDFPYPGYCGAYDFRGLIDEFRVWQGVLSDKEVVELAHGGTLSRTAWACLKLPGRQAVGSDLEWVHCTRPAEGGNVEIRQRVPMLRPLFFLVYVWVSTSCLGAKFNENNVVTQSGLKMWVDPDTPEDRYVWRSSRGDDWELVMSDEFNSPGRSFRPGDDHLWTSLEKPDGVNEAMEVYAHNHTTTACDDSGDCTFRIEMKDAVVQLQVWNGFIETPGLQNVSFFYRGGMVQSWNKFCMQGGMVEVRARLPGAISKESGNPDALLDQSARATSQRYYPTWPGIWMMGNLGRAIFSASTNRMWPFSYDDCSPSIFKPSNQRINACQENPGSGMNPHQGRGAPEIDIVEGGGTVISSSIQVGPGMPTDFRVVPPVDENKLCIYSSSCTTPGANIPGIPESVYLGERGHESWYQRLRYASNNFCLQNVSQVQDYTIVEASLSAGIEDNVCLLTKCPASLDINSDLDYMYPTGEDRWGINSNGTCFAAMNSYMGEFICSPGNADPNCKPLEDAPDLPQGSSTFAFQMDALSANWPVHMAAYMNFVEYQVEWVPGPQGYVRWMVSNQPLFEIPAHTLTHPPQGGDNYNPRKIMIEEPMYLIFNVAMSSKWGAQPPNPKNPCRGDGMDPVANSICDSFPMYLEVDYVRVYQDLTRGSNMSVGCDPKSHPTRQWIIDHLDEYEDDSNKFIDVRGKGFCRSDEDCTVKTKYQRRPGRRPVLSTGRCVNKRCECWSSAWTGPRCIMPSRNGENNAASFGPPLIVAVAVGAAVLAMIVVSCCTLRITTKKRIEAAEGQRKLQQEHQQFVQLRRESSRHLHSAWSSES